MVTTVSTAYKDGVQTRVFELQYTITQELACQRSLLAQW